VEGRGGEEREREKEGRGGKEKKGRGRGGERRTLSPSFQIFWLRP